MSFDPYAPPTAPVQGTETETCPRCGHHDIHTPSYTWWGGALGPRMFHHRVCRACKLGFNAKTRRSNTRTIILYQVVAFAIAIGGLVAVIDWNDARTATGFMQGCTSGCTKKGVSQGECERMCECMSADLRREGDAHFRQLLKEAARTGTAPAEVTEAAARCRAQ
jgi:hypothetical protein